MDIIKSSRTVYFDVDDTLLIFNWKEINPEGKGLILIEDPSGCCAELVMPHLRHIELMRQFKSRGHIIIVWSQGGAEWAGAACKALGIESLVEFALDKPSWYVDDLPSQVWMKNPIYLDPLNPDKDKRWGVADESLLEGDSCE